jgi:pimeloyl-ACP methyl ester carboxylesterase
MLTGARKLLSTVKNFLCAGHYGVIFVTLGMQKILRFIGKTTLISLSVCLVAVLVINGCATKYIYSDKDIKEHYAKKDFTPCFATALYKDKLVHYAQSGNDTMPLLLFIHGGPGAWYGWIDYIDDPQLRKNFNVIAVDRLGYGKSEYGKPELSTHEQSKAILEVVKNFPANKKITIVGKSYGAAIAAMVSKELGNRVEKLIMISPVVNPDKETFYWFSPLGKSKAINWMLPKLMNVATEEKYSHAKAMQEIKSDWKDVTCPTVVVSGGKDWVADTSNFRCADTLLKSCCAKEMIYLPEEGHWIARDRKELVMKLIMK